MAGAPQVAIERVHPLEVDALGCDDLEWARGAAWALQQAMGVVWYYAESNPPMSEMGRRTLQRLGADESRIGWRPSR